MSYRVHGILQARILEWVAIPFSRRYYQPSYPIVQVDSLPAEPAGKSKNTRVGRLSLLQRIFPTQESKLSLLQCRQILLPTELPGKPLLRCYRKHSCNNTYTHKDRAVQKRWSGSIPSQASLKMDTRAFILIPLGVWTVKTMAGLHIYPHNSLASYLQQITYVRYRMVT